MAERVDVSILSDVPVRMQRAARTLRDLLDETAAWSMDHPVEAAVRIAPNDAAVVEVSATPPSAPAYDWSVSLGHAVHDLRAALDHLMQQLCRIEGLEPVKPNRVAFPVAHTAKHWKEARRDLATVPAEVLHRIDVIQPYHSKDVLSRGLDTLHELAIADKHYGLVTLTPIPSSFSLDEIQDWPQDRDVDVNWDELLMRLQVAPPGASDARGKCRVAPIRFSPLLVLKDRAAPLAAVAPWIHGVTGAIVEHVTTGHVAHEVPPEPDWLDC